MALVDNVAHCVVRIHFGTRALLMCSTRLEQTTAQLITYTTCCSALLLISRQPGFVIKHSDARHTRCAPAAHMLHIWVVNNIVQYMIRPIECTSESDASVLRRGRAQWTMLGGGSVNSKKLHKIRPTTTDDDEEDDDGDDCRHETLSKIAIRTQIIYAYGCCYMAVMHARIMLNNWPIQRKTNVSVLYVSVCVCNEQLEHAVCSVRRQ